MGSFLHYAGDFIQTTGSTLDQFILGTQLSQVVGLRHTLERARTMWPTSLGTCYYKLTDVYPAAAWSTIDWYGTPKAAYYFVQDAYAPLHCCVRFDTLQFAGQSVLLPVYALDDTGALSGSWTVSVRAYNESLQKIKQTDFAGSGAVNRVASLGNFTMTATETQSTPLLLVVDLKQGGIILDRTFYFANYVASKNCLFNLPVTQVTAAAVGTDSVRITNSGAVPAVAVNLQSGNGDDKFLVSDNLFWLDAGETRTLWANDVSKIQVSAWNSTSHPTPFPAISSVSASVSGGAGTVQIQFNTPLDKASLQNSASYTISAGVMVLSSVASADRRSVTLSVSGMQSGSHYTLAVAGLCDQSAPPQCLTIGGLDFVPTSSLMGYWAFNENAGNIAHDSTPALNHAGLTNVTWTPGRFGAGVRFGSTGARASIAGANLNPGTNFAITCWVKPDALRGSYHVFLAKGDKVNGHYEFYIGQDGVFHFYAPDLGDFSSAKTIDDATWHFVAVDRAGTRLSFYVDGSEVGVQTLASASALTTMNDSLILGSLKDGSFAYQGSLDELRMYRRDLSVNELDSLYHGNQIPTGAVKMPPALLRTGLLSVSQNPLGASIRVTFGLATTESLGAELYDVQGRKVTTLLPKQVREAGVYSVEWGGSRGTAAAGMILLKYRIGDKTGIRKISMVR
jgi:hypothetical protein